MICPKCQSQNAEPIVSLTMLAPVAKRIHESPCGTRFSSTPRSTEPGGSVWSINGHSYNAIILRNIIE